MSSDLFSKDSLTDFWPSDGRTYLENTNATIRFILYASVLVYILTGDYRVVYLGVVVIAFLLSTLDSKGVSYFEDRVDAQPSVPKAVDLVQKQQSILTERQFASMPSEFNPSSWAQTAYPTIHANGTSAIGNPDFIGSASRTMNP